MSAPFPEADTHIILLARRGCSTYKPTGRTEGNSPQVPLSGRDLRRPVTTKF